MARMTNKTAKTTVNLVRKSSRPFFLLKKVCAPPKTPDKPADLDDWKRTDAIIPKLTIIKSTFKAILTAAGHLPLKHSK